MINGVFQISGYFVKSEDDVGCLADNLLPGAITVVQQAVLGKYYYRIQNSVLF